ARRLRLAIGEVIGVEEPEALAHPLAQVAAVALEGLGAADVDIRKVEWRMAVLEPLRQREAGAARRDDADRVVAAGHPEAAGLRRLAEIVAVIGREAFRAVEEGVDAGLAQNGHPVDAHLEDRLEVLDVLGQLVEAEI